MRTIPEKLKGLREDNDLTQAQVAAVLGTSQTMYVCHACGSNEMPIRNLVTLCKVYNVSADYLLSTVPDSRRRQKKSRVKEKHQD